MIGGCLCFEFGFWYRGSEFCLVCWFDFDVGLRVWFPVLFAVVLMILVLLLCVCCVFGFRRVVFLSVRSLVVGCWLRMLCVGSMSSGYVFWISGLLVLVVGVLPFGVLVVGLWVYCAYVCFG